MNESNFEVVKAANLRKDDPSNEYEQTHLSKVATKIAVELAMEKALKEVKEPKTPTLVVRPRSFGNFYPNRPTTISTTNSIKGLIAIKKYKPTKSTGTKSCRIISINFYSNQYSPITIGHFMTALSTKSTCHFSFRF